MLQQKKVLPFLPGSLLKGSIKVGTNNGHKCREISVLVNTDKEKRKRLLVAIGKGKSLSEQFKVSVWCFNKIPTRISVKIPARISR